MKAFSILLAVLLFATNASAQTCESECSASTSNCADCMTCAIYPGGYCAYFYDLCSSWPECSLAAGCYYLLPDRTAYVGCLESMPAGTALYAALIDCMVCVQCPGCDPWGWVDPHPGCGDL